MTDKYNDVNGLKMFPKQMPVIMSTFGRLR